jgi:hypothetical protein
VVGKVGVGMVEWVLWVSSYSREMKIQPRTGRDPSYPSTSSSPAPCGRRTRLALALVRLDDPARTTLLHWKLFERSTSELGLVVLLLVLWLADDGESQSRLLCL